MNKLVKSSFDYPLVSVIMPSYNHEAYISYAILSIINQTYKNLELIIIDDGSIDNTLNTIKKYESECKERFVNFYYTKQSNNGISKTLNKLIKISNGEYIYNCI